MSRDPAGRNPPQDLDGEAVVLSAVLNDREALDRLAPLLKAEDFFSDANATIWRTCCAIATAGGIASPISVAAYLRDRELLSGVGGNAYLQQLALETPYQVRLEDVARRLHDKARVRRCIAHSQRIAAEGYAAIEDVEAWLLQAASALHDVVDDRADERCPTLGEALKVVFDRLVNGAEEGGVRTGLRALDALLGPLKPGQLVIIGAHSGIGKSALALEIAKSVTLNPEQPAACLFFSAEMEREELAVRALFSESRMNSRKLNYKKTITPEEWARLSASAEVLSPASFFVDDEPSLTTAAIASKARRLQTQQVRQGLRPLRLVVVDYVQLLEPLERKKSATRENEVSQMGRELKVMAKALGLPVLALAQLNDDANKGGARGKPRKPRGSDLRESKALLQHSDKVVLIDNPHAQRRAEEYRQGMKVKGDLPAEVVDLIVDKNRGMSTGTVQAQFWPSYTLFEDVPGTEAVAE